MDSGKESGKYYTILGLGFKNITPSNGESNEKECGKLGGKWDYIGAVYGLGFPKKLGGSF